MALIDRFIIEFDTALRSVVGGAHAHRPMPGSNTPSSGLLDAKEREHAAGLMRVNHVGEVCAQALYQAQKLVARNPEIRQMLDESGQEEMDHLAWCETRLQELARIPVISIQFGMQDPLQSVWLLAWRAISGV